MPGEELVGAPNPGGIESREGREPGIWNNLTANEAVFMTEEGPDILRRGYISRQVSLGLFSCTIEMRYVCEWVSEQRYQLACCFHFTFDCQVS